MAVANLQFQVQSPQGFVASEVAAVGGSLARSTNPTNPCPPARSAVRYAFLPSSPGRLVLIGVGLLPEPGGLEICTWLERRHISPNRAKSPRSGGWLMRPTRSSDAWPA